MKKYFVLRKFFGSPASEHHCAGGDLIYLLRASSCLLLLYAANAVAQMKIPGSDESGKLQAAGTLLRMVDTGLFVWVSRILVGLCVFSAGWLIKEQKFGPAVVCIVGGLIIGTAPMWVTNIFEIGGGAGVFR